MSISTLPAFNTSYNYKKWRTSLLELAKTKDVLELIISAKEYKLIEGIKPELINSAGPEPQPIQDSDNNKQIEIKKEQHRRWVLQDQKYREKLKNLALLKEILINSLKPSIRDSISDPIYGTLQITCFDILKNLDQEFLLLSPTHFKQANQSLLIPFKLGDDMREFLNKRKLHYQLCEHADQDIGEEFKITSLEEVLRPCGLFTRPIERFNELYDTLDSNSRTFDALAILIQRAADNLPNNQNIFAASIYPESKSSAETSNPNTGIAAAVKTGKGKAVSNKDSISKDLNYCWSHGPNTSHNSKQCKTRHPNHVESATAKNMQGGRIEKWVFGSSLGP